MCLANKVHYVNVSNFYCLAGQKKKLAFFFCLPLPFFFPPEKLLVPEIQKTQTYSVRLCGLGGHDPCLIFLLTI